MPQYVNVNEDFFSLQDSASIAGLLNAIARRHPALKPQMMAAMLILVNGVSGISLDFTLKDGDEVEFIPLFAGG
jgi:molybdopterin converting factor small subunit